LRAHLHHLPRRHPRARPGLRLHGVRRPVGPSPVTHTTGLVTSVLLPLLYGAATHLMPEWEPGRGLAEIASTAAP
jgi:hypothetical protein